MGKYKLLRYIGRGLAISFLTLGVAKLTYFFVFWMSTPKESPMREVPLFALNIVSVLGAAFIFNSFVHLFTLYDREQRESFLSADREISFFGELWRILLSFEYITETAVVLVIGFLLSALGAIDEVNGIFFIEKAPEGALAAFFPSLVVCPLFAIISLLCRYEIRRYWRVLYKRRDLDLLDSKIRLVVRVAVIFIGYPLVYPFAPFIGFVVISLVGVFVELSALLTALGVCLAILLLIALGVGLSYAGAIRKRKRFIKKLTEMAVLEGYTLGEIKYPIKSFFSNHDGESFRLCRGGRVYVCRFVSTVSRNVPLFFSSTKEAYLLHRLGTKNHHFSFQHNFEWGFDAEEGEIKLLIVNPMPKHVFAISNDGTTRRLNPADKLWDTVIYDDTTFLGAMDRDCLGRAN